MRTPSVCAGCSQGHSGRRRPGKDVDRAASDGTSLWRRMSSGRPSSSILSLKFLMFLAFVSVLLALPALLIALMLICAVSRPTRRETAFGLLRNTLASSFLISLVSVIAAWAFDEPQMIGTLVMLTVFCMSFTLSHVWFIVKKQSGLDAD